MLLKSNAIGGDSFLTNTFPPRVSFSKITLYGDAYFDNLHIQNIELSDEEILATDRKQTWLINSILLADFENNLQAGNYTTLTLPITSYRVKRRKVGDLLYKPLAEIQANKYITSFIDYTNKNNQYYEYAVLPVSNNTEGYELKRIVKSTFYGWFLTDINNTISYKFNMQFESGDIKVNEDVKVIENYTEYPLINKGIRKYSSGSIKSIPSSDSKVDVSIDKLNELKSFINSNEEKYLKNSKGEIWKVKTSNFNYKYMDNIQDQPYTISFDFIQTGDGDL